MRDQDFRHSRRRDFDVDTYHSQPRAFGTQRGFSQPRFEAPSGPPVRGVVKWFNVEKGYGFVALDAGKDVFVHVSALERSGLTGLAEGQPVIVDVVDGRKGPEATRVRLA